MGRVCEEAELLKASPVTDIGGLRWRRKTRTRRSAKHKFSNNGSAASCPAEAMSDVAAFVGSQQVTQPDPDQRSRTGQVPSQMYQRSSHLRPFNSRSRDGVNSPESDRFPSSGSSDLFPSSDAEENLVEVDSLSSTESIIDALGEKALRVRLLLAECNAMRVLLEDGRPNAQLDAGCAEVLLQLSTNAMTKRLQVSPGTDQPIPSREMLARVFVLIEKHLLTQKGMLLNDVEDLVESIQWGLRNSRCIGRST